MSKHFKDIDEHETELLDETDKYMEQKEQTRNRRELKKQYNNKKHKYDDCEWR